MQEGLMFQVRPVPVCFTKWRDINWWSPERYFFCFGAAYSLPD
jgi:hypothetical protein